MPYVDEALLAALVSTGRERITPVASEGEERAFSKVARLCCARERCVSELRSRLAREGFSSEDSERALRRALDCGLVDDARYAEVLVRSRIAQGKGRPGIRAELEAAGIDASSVPGWQEECAADGPSETERALEVLRRRPPRAKDVRAAAYRRLAGKGYSQQVAYEAAKIYAREAGACRPSDSR